MAGKRYRADAQKIDRNKTYALDEALALLESFSSPKFDETVDVAIRLGVDPKQSDQAVRGSVALPHGLGKKIRVAVFAKSEKAQEATDAGAEVVGGEELAKKIEGGWFEFDQLVATPDLMGVVGRLGKVLGPRGLMPNPKLGTVTNDVAKAVKEVKAGRVEFRLDKASIIHAPVGKRSFGTAKLKENIQSVVDAVIKGKPQTAKGVYLRGIAISATMSPSVRLNPEGFMSE